MFKLLRILAILNVLLSAGYCAQAQSTNYDTILVSAIVRNGDTFPFRWLDPIFVVGITPEWRKQLKKNMAYKQNMSSAEYSAYYSLRNKVIKVFPYAVAAGNIAYDVDSVMKHLHSKDAQKAYKQRREAELYRRFKGELTDMTISEGKVLIKLIARQTGKDVYTVIDELKGSGFAVASQGVAKLFGHNLKDYYEPNGADVQIEAIVRELELNGYKEIKF